MKYLFMLLFVGFGALSAIGLTGIAEGASGVEILLMGLIASIFLVGAGIIDAIDKLSKQSGEK